MVPEAVLHVARYITHSNIFENGDVKPYLDNVNALGGPGNRFSTVYLGSNPVVTSDGTLKTEPVLLTKHCWMPGVTSGISLING